MPKHDGATASRRSRASAGRAPRDGAHARGPEGGERNCPARRIGDNRRMPTESALLAEVPLFALLDEQERGVLAEKIDHVTFARDTRIFQYGDPGDSLYVVASGEVELSVRNDTGEKIVLEV